MYSFKELTPILTSSPIFHYFADIFLLTTDVSSFAFDAVLSQGSVCKDLLIRLLQEAYGTPKLDMPRRKKKTKDSLNRNAFSTNTLQLEIEANH